MILNVKLKNHKKLETKRRCRNREEEEETLLCFHCFFTNHARLLESRRFEFESNSNSPTPNLFVMSSRLGGCLSSVFIKSLKSAVDDLSGLGLVSCLERARARAVLGAGSG
ncbi:hypothetical protein L3X38_037842 [Prunus dulcis]|uniref:Uncharacterized protein n=1 Tax=Prunus dulcis TaxID=3755 RepID=A0AAD4V461_PRUDU|nr:hypothetical protein L3X38_037842 [Prunus dulcis]